METGTQETTTTEKVTLSIEDENISQSDYERLRVGDTVEVEREKSAPAAKAASKTTDDSDTSETEEEVEKEDGEGESEVEEIEDEAAELTKPKKKSGTQRRIEKLVKQRAEAEREREYWREQALKNQTQKPEATEPEVKAATKEGKPNPDDFESHEDYLDARDEWVAKKVRDDLKSEEEKKRVKSDYDSLVESHKQRLKAFAETVDDFDDALDSVNDIAVPVALQEAILRSDIGPELMYELAQNRDELERIVSLSAPEALMELGAIKLRLKADSSEENKTKTTIKPKTTKAPPPAKPISASSASVKKSLHEVAEKGTQAEYERMREEQERRRRA